jgi:hypothetical protein
MKLKLITITGILLLALTGCGTTTDTSGEEQAHTFYTFYQDLPDGSKVLCIAEDFNGAISCDWANKVEKVAE